MAKSSVVLGTLLALAASGALAETPVEKHGQLSVKGNTVVDQHGEPTQLRGMSLFWSQWTEGSIYWNKDAIKWLASDWKVSIVRAAMGVEAGGYLENPEREKAKMITVVDAAIEAGIYVIIDWHEEQAQSHVEQSKAFFSEMAQKYGDKPNVLFETFNEPRDQDWSSVIKPYHVQIVQEIRKHTDNIVICGTRTWSQEVDVASRDPVPGKNIAYTLHFYAATHKQDVRNRAQAALNNGAAIWVTEWGTCEASGNGALNLGETQTWMNFLAQHHISSSNWAIDNKPESCAALTRGAGGSGGWSTSQLTQSGQWVRNFLRSDPAPVPSPSPSPPGAGHCCFDGCGSCTEGGWCGSQANCEGSCHGQWCPGLEANATAAVVV